MEPTLASAPVAEQGASRSSLWHSVDALVDRSPDIYALWWHGLHLIGARRMRARGLTVPEDIYSEERESALAVLGAPEVLKRIREACEGELVLIKGYEVALLYEDAALRPFVDLDLLVEDSETTHAALLRAGFVEIGDPELFVGIHHQRPLWLPGLPLAIEIHHAPKWPDRLTPPPTRELLDAAIPSATGVDGILTLPPAHHAVILAAHSWAHRPLRRIQELVDIAAMTRTAERREIERLARSWKIDRVWRTSIKCADSLFHGSEKPVAERLWARHLPGAREQTVLESHVQRWLSPFWTLPPHLAFRELGTVIVDEFRAGEGETWHDKRARARRAVRNALVPRSRHDEELGPGAHRRRRS